MKAAGTQDNGDLQLILRHQQQAYFRQGFPHLLERLDRLDRAIALLLDNEQSLCDVLVQDFNGGSPHHISTTEISAAVSSLKNARRSLPQWMKTHGKADTRYQPKGVVGLVATWRSPVWSSLGALAGVVAAGNRCLIQISDEVPQTARLLEKLTRQYFDAEELKLIAGNAKVAEDVCRQVFDHLLFFGAGHDITKTLQAAAESGTSATLIHSGKSPVIIGKNADLKQAALALVKEKGPLAGQGFFATECVLVREGDLNELIADMERASQNNFPSMLKNPDYSALTQQRYQCMQDFLDDARSKGGEIWELNLQKENFHGQSTVYKMPITLVVNPSNDLRMMQEEICGPILVIKSYRHLDEVTEFFQEQETPQVLAYFGKDKVEQENVVMSTSSNVLMINNPSLNKLQLFQGIDGFRLFSRARTIQCSS